MNSDIKLTNCQITNSGYYNAYLVAGGSYDFYHCTIANFYNCIVDGNQENEMAFVKKEDVGFNI